MTSWKESDDGKAKDEIFLMSVYFFKFRQK